MKNHSPQQLLLLAKSRQIEALEAISLSTKFVKTLGYLIHQLQIERGTSGLFIASDGRKFNTERIDIIKVNTPLIMAFDDELSAFLQQHIAANAKQLTLIAWVLLGFKQLNALRAQIQTLSISFMGCMQAYTRLIDSLISLLFEVIDNAADSKISKALATLYNVVLAKEAAGQERAIGAYLIGSGKFSEAHHQHFQVLIETQVRHFSLATQLASDAMMQAWQQHEGEALKKVHQEFREKILQADQQVIFNPQDSDTWFDVCSKRLANIWAMQCDAVGLISQELNALIAKAKLELAKVKSLLDTSTDNINASDTDAEFFDLNIPLERAFLFMSDSNPAPYPIQSISHLLQQQSRQIADIENELTETKKALSERKVIERAKGMLMEKMAFNELDAYQSMRKTAMDQNRKLIDIAENIISLHRG